MSIKNFLKNKKYFKGISGWAIKLHRNWSAVFLKQPINRNRGDKQSISERYSFRIAQVLMKVLHESFHFIFSKD